MPRLRSEAGISLAEVLVALAILGLSVVTIVAAHTTAVLSSTRLEAATRSDVVARIVAESVKGQPYAACATTYTSAGSDVPYPSGWGAAAMDVRVAYWRGDDPPTFSSTCSTDRGLQLVTISATAPSGRGARTIEILKRSSP